MRQIQITPRLPKESFLGAIHGAPRKGAQSSVNQESLPERRENISRVILSNLSRGCPVKSLQEHTLSLGEGQLPMVACAGPLLPWWKTAWKGLESSPFLYLFIRHFLALALWITRMTKIKGSSEVEFPGASTWPWVLGPCLRPESHKW